MSDIPAARIRHLSERSAFDGLLKSIGQGGGVTVEDRSNLELATLIARKGQEGPLAARMEAAFGLRLPSGPRRGVSETMAAVGIGPQAWLMTQDANASAERGMLAKDLTQALGSLAAVTDQSSGYAVLRISGPKARETFAKGLDIDLHPRVFSAGMSAATACSHIGVTIWQLDEAPTYEVALFRSMAGSFWHWLSESAAEFGLAV
jgi:methylglutamate dehydrogenase subunit D